MPGKNTAMLIEDDELLQAVISVGLEAEGFYVIMASNAEEAEKFLLEIKPDLIVLDRALSDINSIREHCRKIFKRWEIPIIAIGGAENVNLEKPLDDKIAKTYDFNGDKSGLDDLMNRVRFAI
ncbi:response regulator [Desulfoscipio geothermicus]|uniref:Stage 0 sporulation protein A homolog n=1 Tax=Desulfoscipio geothermicus DSM 3669 TaxID=1121426 RepID=A0A1I6D1W6_9FIRM|nr:response regulator [Desulfoscipio geothermicus]SFQ99465.1 Response regulator receiver domain-containing protein [Desulfoscipio geothermicus DSM 3669]